MTNAGGTGGLGLLAAAWMQLNGAKDLTLTGRTGRLSSTAALDFLITSPGMVTLKAADAASAEGAASLAISNGALPLGGMLHAAGIQVHRAVAY